MLVTPMRPESLQPLPSLPSPRRKLPAVKPWSKSACRIASCRFWRPDHPIVPRGTNEQTGSNRPGDWNQRDTHLKKTLLQIHHDDIQIYDLCLENPREMDWNSVYPSKNSLKCETSEQCDHSLSVQKETTGNFSHRNDMSKRLNWHLANIN